MNDYIPAEDVEAPISFTGKIGGNLMTIRGNTVEEFVERVDAFIDGGGIQKAAEFNDLCNAAGVIQEKLGNANSGRQSGGQRSGGQRQGGASRPAPQNDDVEYHPEGVTCGACNEPVVYKKIAKGNRSFELWTCPNQRSRNDGHHSEFIN